MERVSSRLRMSLGAMTVLALMFGVLTVPASAVTQYAVLSASCGGPVTIKPGGFPDIAEVTCTVAYAPEPTRSPVGQVSAIGWAFFSSAGLTWEMPPTTATFEPPATGYAGLNTVVNLRGTLVSSSGLSKLVDLVINARLPEPPPDPVEQVQDTATLITAAAELPSGTSSSLLSTLSAAQKSLQSGSTTSACGQLTSFANKVSAQSGRSIDAGLAAQLTSAAQQIRTTAGCR